MLGGAAFLIVLVAMFIAAVPLSSDTLRHRIVKTLAARLDSDVELGDLQVHVFPGLHAEGADLRVRRRGMGDYPPLIASRSRLTEACSVCGGNTSATFSSMDSTSTFRQARLGTGRNKVRREKGESRRQKPERRGLTTP